MSEQPKSTEPVPVQLTRIEGTVNLIAYQMTEVKGEVANVRADVAALAGRVHAVELVQAQNAGSSASWKTWLPILAALAAVGASVVGLLTGG